MRNYLLRIFFVLALLQGSLPGSAQDDEDTSAIDVAPPYDEDGPTGITEKSSPFTVPSADKREIPDSVMSNLKARDEYWYHNYEPEQVKEEKVREENDIPLFKKQWFKNLVWALIIAIFIGGLLWYLASSNVRLFRRESKKIDSDEIEITEDIFSLDYAKEISAAVQRGDFRLAVRLQYLRLLRAMADSGKINYTQEKTNSDYLLQLYGTKLYDGFFRLTRIFDYTWYGEFPLDQNRYAQISTEFENLESAIQ